MNDEDRKKLLEAEFYQSELRENKRSVEALVALLKHKGINHPQYNQLAYLEERDREIDSQLIGLDKIINNLISKIEND